MNPQAHPTDNAPSPTGRQAAALTHEQLLALTEARRQGRRISRAAVVAAVSGWTMACFAFITVLFGIFSVVRKGLASGGCVRITPQVFNTPDEIGQFVDALKALA